MNQKQDAINAIDESIMKDAIEYLLDSTLETSFASSATDTDSFISDSSDDDVLVSPLCLRMLVEDARYIAPRELLPKSKDFVERILPILPDHIFRQQIRMSKDSFNHILNLIKDDVVFKNNSNCMQADPRFQLYVACYRFGFYGNAAGLSPVSMHFGIGAGTVNLYTSRVIIALLRIEQTVVYWPDADERKEIAKRVREKYGFPNCVAFLDGTLIPLHREPALKGSEYWTRKRNYALNMSIACDDRKRVRYVISGYTGKVHDNRVYANCKLAINPAKYFSDNEYMLGDSAYAISPTMITPFKCTSLRAQIEFNLRHSQLRVLVENCFGMLKGRFQSLKELRIDINSRSDHARCNYWIRAICVLHNLLVDLDYCDAEWHEDKDIAGDDDNDEDADQMDVLLDDGMTNKQKGEQKRNFLKDFVQNFFD